MNLYEFEAELTAALRSVEAPASLADAVMARVALSVDLDAPRGRVLPWQRAGWLAAAACLLAGVLSEGLHVRRERQRAEAERQFALAEVLTGRALEHARGQLARAGIRLGKEVR